MAYRTLEVTLMSAKDLKNVNLFSRMEVYAVVSISGDPRSRQRTPADREGRCNPAWNHTLRFTVPADDPGHLALHVLLRAERVLGDRDVGEVHIPLRELLAGAGDSTGPPKFVSYQVRRPTSGKARGVLNFSYKLGERVAAPAAPAASPYPTPAGQPVNAYPVGPSAAGAYPPPAKAGKANEPVTAYPAAYPPPPAPYGPSAPYPAPSGYPGYPQPQPYGYAAAPQPYGYAAAPQPGYGGYGYPPTGYGYGAPPQPVVQPARKNNFGMGLGAGLLGGALGGLLIGDMISDAGAYDAGYDTGFGDGGGFGF